MTSLPSTVAPAPLRWAFRLWIVVAVAVSVRTFVSPVQHTVYPVLAGATAHWWADRPVYADYKPLDYFRYPPAFAVAFTPFALLGPTAGGVLWTLVGVAVLLLGLWRFLRDVIPDEWTGGREAVFLALCAVGSLRGLWNAQSNALAVGLLLLGAAALARRRWWAAAAALAASILVKATPLAPALLLCTLRPWRLGPRLALLLALGLVAPFLTRPPGMVLAHYREWFEQMALLGGERWPGHRDAWTVWLVVRQGLSGLGGMPPLKEPLHSVVYRAVQLLSAAAALLWCLRQRRIADARLRTTLVMAMGLSWLMLFGPATEHATYGFLAPVLCWGLLRRDGRPGGRWLVGAAAVLILGLGWDALARSAADAAPALLTTLPAGTALFTLWLVSYGSENVTQSRQEQRPISEGRRPDGPIAA